jgi:hypothetical protein
MPTGDKERRGGHGGAGRPGRIPSSTLAKKLTFYSDGYLTILAPNGWPTLNAGRALCPTVIQEFVARHFPDSAG